MNIRTKIFHGKVPPPERVLLAKQPKGAKADDLLSVKTPRTVRRATNHRLEDRHRLLNEHATLRWNGADHRAELINLSDGGAMVRCPLETRLWEPVQLHIGPNGTIDCVVCWRRDDAIGLQFAQETRLECPASEIAALLRGVISRSFPDLEFALSEQPPGADNPDIEFSESREAIRHPMIWNGVLHHDYQSNDIRVRNISRTGAMIESAVPVRMGIEPLLELSEAVSISATVEWVVGNQVGLRFHSPFDLGLLANARPAVARSAWSKPAYLDADGEREWDRRWRRLNADRLRDDLEGFLKR